MQTANDVWGFARLLVWFSWPAWPLVLWALWRWRQQWHSGHVLQPLMVIALMSMLGFTLSLPGLTLEFLPSRKDQIDPALRG